MTVDGAVPDLDESLTQLLLVVAVQAIVPEPRLEIFSVWLGGRVCLERIPDEERWVGLTPIVFSVVTLSDAAGGLVGVSVPQAPRLGPR